MPEHPHSPNYDDGLEPKIDWLAMLEQDKEIQGKLKALRIALTQAGVDHLILDQLQELARMVGDLQENREALAYRATWPIEAIRTLGPEEAREQLKQDAADTEPPTPGIVQDLGDPDA